MRPSSLGPVRTSVGGTGARNISPYPASGSINGSSNISRQQHPQHQQNAGARWSNGSNGGVQERIIRERLSSGRSSRPESPASIIGDAWANSPSGSLAGEGISSSTRRDNIQHQLDDDDWSAASSPASNSRQNNDYSLPTEITLQHLAQSNMDILVCDHKSNNLVVDELNNRKKI